MDEVSLLAHLGMTVFTGLNSPPPGATPGITNFLLPQANGGLTAHIYF
jgi:hypothetical protein